MSVDPKKIAIFGQTTDLAGLQPSLISTFGYIDFITENDWVPRHELMLRALWPQKQLLDVPSNYEG